VRTLPGVRAGAGPPVVETPSRTTSTRFVPVAALQSRTARTETATSETADHRIFMPPTLPEPVETGMRT
jgi:hypothetical protein